MYSYELPTLTNEQKRKLNLNLIWVWALDTEGYPGRALSTFHRDCEYPDRGQKGFNQPSIACCLAWAERELNMCQADSAEIFRELASKFYETDSTLNHD